jgi:hypothetical protein
MVRRRSSIWSRCRGPREIPIRIRSRPAGSRRETSTLAPSNGGPATSVALTLFADDGRHGPLEVTLAAGEVKQIDSVIALFTGSPVEGGALVVAPRAGAVVASAVRIDNATNDPCGLSPVPAPSLAP